jgi:hypothetical protein
MTGQDFSDLLKGKQVRMDCKQHCKISVKMTGLFRSVKRKACKKGLQAAL